MLWIASFPLSPSSMRKWTPEDSFGGSSWNLKAADKIQFAAWVFRAEPLTAGWFQKPFEIGGHASWICLQIFFPPPRFSASNFRGSPKTLAASWRFAWSGYWLEWPVHYWERLKAWQPLFLWRRGGNNAVRLFPFLRFQIETSKIQSPYVWFGT